MVRTGAYAYAKYGWEDDDSPNVFGGTATQIANSFGAKTAITGWTLTTNRTNLGKLGQVEPAVYAYGQQSGTLGVGFVLSDTTSHEIFRNFYGAGVGNGNHSQGMVYGTNAAGGALKNFLGNSFTTEIGFTADTDTMVRTLKGCIINTLSLSATIGGTVDCTADIVYGKEDNPSTSVSAAATEGGKPFTFAHGTVKLSDGSGNSTVVAEVQDVDINFAQNSELLYQIGSNQAVSGIKKVLDITGRFRIAWNDNNAVEAVIAQLKGANYKETWADKYAVGSDTIEFELKFTNGVTEGSAGERTLKIIGSGLSLTDHNVSGLEPVEPVFEELNWQVKTAKIVSVHS